MEFLLFSVGSLQCPFRDMIKFTFSLQWWIKIVKFLTLSPSPPFRSNLLHFHAVFRIICLNGRLVPPIPTHPPFGIGTPVWEIQGYAPFSVQFLSFSYSYRQKSCQIIGFWPKLRGWRPPPNLWNPLSGIDLQCVINVHYIVLVDSSAAQQEIGALPLSLDVHWLPREE